MDVVLVTGAGRGMGLACARRFAAHATLVLADLDGVAAERAAADLERRGARAHPVAGDVSDWLCFSPGATFLTGTDLRLDGGVTAALKYAGR